MVKLSINNQKELSIKYIDSLFVKSKLEFLSLFCNDITDKNGYKNYFSIKTEITQSMYEIMCFENTFSTKFNSLDEIKKYINKKETVIETIKVPINNIIKIKTINITNIINGEK